MRLFESVCLCAFACPCALDGSEGESETKGCL